MTEQLVLLQIDPGQDFVGSYAISHSTNDRPSRVPHAYGTSTPCWWPDHGPRCPHRACHGPTRFVYGRPSDMRWSARQCCHGQPHRSSHGPPRNQTDKHLCPWRFGHRTRGANRSGALTTKNLKGWFLRLHSLALPKNPLQTLECSRFNFTQGAISLGIHGSSRPVSLLIGHFHQ